MRELRLAERLDDFRHVAVGTQRLDHRLAVGSVANFKTAAGQLTVFLVLTTYAYASSITFLVGVQADELMWKGSRRRGGIFSGVRAVTGG